MSSAKIKCIRIKMISMGNAESGKSCIIKRYCEKRFVNKYLPTVGIDYGVTKVSLNNKDLKVNIFDMAGHPYFYEVRNEFYRDAQAAILVYDVTDRKSFENLNTWLSEMREELGKSQCIDKTLFCVCANKIDKSNRIVDGIEGRLWAESRGYKYFETSAVTGMGIQEMFETMFSTLIDQHENPGINFSSKMNIGFTKEQADAVIKIKNGRDNYERLGVHPNSTREDINKAYRKLAMILHPDKSVAPGSEDAFKTLVNARTSLLRNK